MSTDKVNCESISKFAKINGLKPKDIEIIKEPYNGWKIKRLNNKICPSFIEEVINYIKVNS